MDWTKTPPKKPGYYWWRHKHGSKKYIHDLKQEQIDIYAKYPDEPSGEWWPCQIEEPDEWPDIPGEDN